MSETKRKIFSDAFKARVVLEAIRGIQTMNKIGQEFSVLSGFLPVQSVYANIYVRDEYWPDFEPQHFEHTLA